MNSNNGSIRNLRVRGFLRHGITLRDARNWEIADNIVEEIGCDDVETRCHDDWLRSNPGCDGDNHETPECPFLDPQRWYPNSPKTTSLGQGIYLAGSSTSRPRGHVVRNNVVRKATKSCITLYAAGPKMPIEDIAIEDNDLSECGIMGISVHHNAKRVFIRNNRIESAGYPANLGATGIGIGCATVATALLIEGNTISRAYGEGLNLACSLNNSLVRNNTITQPCISRAPERAAGFGIDLGPLEPSDRGTGTTLLADNEVVGAAACRAALRVRNVDHVVIDGGRYTGGRNAVVRIESAHDAVLRGGVSIFGTPPNGTFRQTARGIYISDRVHGGRIETSTTISGARRPLKVSERSGISVCSGSGAPHADCR
jgi:hypothetical protein